MSSPQEWSEREADRIADAIAGGTRSVSSPTRATAGASLQRKCAACEEEDKKISRKSDSASPATHVPEHAALGVENLRQGGTPLSASDRLFFGSRLGFDFSRVRVHTDAPAAQSARALNAHAYTFGNHVVFGAGRYEPHTPRGLRLLTHELVHVVQQGGEPHSNEIQRQAYDAPTHSESTAGVPGVPSEKWSEQIEHQYTMRGDAERASAVRTCRTSGACDHLLSVDEAYRLFQLARSAHGDRAAVEAGLPAAAPLLAPRTLPVGPARPPLRLVPPPAPGPGPGVRPGPGVGVGVAVIVTIVVMAGIELWEFGRFQQELRAQGFVILENPLGLCIGGCHLPSPRPSPFPAFPRFPSSPDRGPSPFFPEQDEPLSPDTRDLLERWLREQGQPRTGEEPARAPEPAPQPAPGRPKIEKSCATEYPSIPLCASLPADYVFRSPQAALEEMKRQTGDRNLRLHNRQPTTGGPCPGIGAHYNVRSGSRRVGSIVCCPCCDETARGPVSSTRCRIVW